MKRDQTLVKRAKELRKDQTPAEAEMWEWIRAKRMLGLKFRRQYGIGRYWLDFYCPELKLAIELDGSQHAEEEQEKHDRVRTKFLKSQGIKVLRFWNDQILKNGESSYDHLVEELKKLEKG